MSYFPCPICTQTDGFHTSGCREASERIATLEAQLAEAKRLDDNTAAMLSKYGVLSLHRLPDWNFAVYVAGVCGGIGMTVAQAMEVAKSNIEKIDEAIAAAASAAKEAQ